MQFNAGPVQLDHCVNLNINTRPDSEPMETVDSATAEHDGRYSEGSHSKFSELHVIHVRSKFMP